TPTSAGRGRGHLAVATDTSVLPANLMIADWGSHKLLVVSPTGQTVWSYTQSSFVGRGFNPDDAFFNPAGSEIAITEESHSKIELVRVKTKQPLFTYGHFDGLGSGPNYLHTPSAAIVYADNELTVPDIDNCRVALIAPPKHVLLGQLGKTGHCKHDPPARFDNPQAAFPLRGGGVVVTELHDNWIDLINAHGKLESAVQAPGFKLTYGANETPDGDLIAVDHTHPGAVEIFTPAGKRVWLYAPKHGRGKLFDPSLAEQLPDGDVIVSDTYHDRVIVIDYHTKKIVWQYGRTGHPGGSAGRLDVPVGFDLVHPDSLLDRIASAAPPS
ncbi:MAG TPA: hypothetical protein VL977_06625, partial [Solirubrobacteraceae bacterium]|nr:hypothetical protein [Solirubrobacteraceae bacterium]